jgi:RNA polymerase sigma-70 factor (ECF subfamily)
MATTKPTLVYSAPRAEPWAEKSDPELLDALAQDQEEALDELIRRKTKPLMQAVYRILSDLEESRDVVQMAFVRIWENRGKFDPRWSPNTWIFRIATNLAIDLLRSRRTRERSADPVRRHLRQVADGQGQRELSNLERREVMQIFERLADQLTEKQRAVFLLREVEGRPSQEVAEIVGCRESTVRNHLFNARKVLREELVKQYPEYAARSPQGRLALAEQKAALEAVEATP